MQLGYLREFIEVVSASSFSEAARLMNTTQSTLSKHVLALEKECGAELLTRSNQAVRPTTEGRILLEEAVTIIEAHDRSLRRIEAIKKNPPVSLGGLYLNAHVLGCISSVLGHAKLMGNPLLVSYNNDAQRPYAEMVADGEIDIAFTMAETGAAAPHDTDILHLFDDPLVAVVHETHPLSMHESICFADLDGKRMLAPTGAHSIAGEHLIRALLRKHGVQPLLMPVFLRSIQDFPTLDIADNILVLEESILRQQTLRPGFKAIPFSDADANFPFYALLNRNNTSDSFALFKKLLKNVVDDHHALIRESDMEQGALA